MIQASLGGDARAYRQLYERYVKAMYNTALRITGNSADAEDVVQDAFTDAYVQLSSFQSRASFGTWLRQIVIYKSIALLKKKKVQLVELENDDIPEETGASKEVWTNLTVEDVHRCMALLPDGYRTILSLYLLEGYSQEDIGAIMGITHSTVRTQYMRGRKKLADLLYQSSEPLL